MLENLIGISPDLSPDATLHLSELPNVNIRVADSTVGDDHISGKALLEGIISTAAKLILEDAVVYFNPSVLQKKVIENDTAGKYKQNAEAISSEAGKYKGIQIRLDNPGFFDIYIDSVQIHSEEATTTTLKIFNLFTGEELSTQSVTLTEGYNEVDVSLLVKTWNQRIYLAVLTDATYDTVDTDIYGSYSGCKGCRTKTFGNQYLSFYGTQVATADEKKTVNFSSLSHTNGIAVRYSLQCSTEAFVYKFKNLLAQPIWYKAAELLMERVQYDTQRVNTVVTIHSSTAEELKNHFGRQYAERMKFVLQNVRIPQNDTCFACNVRVKYKTVI